MSGLIKRFAKNTAGRDFAVGDIHGCFTKLQRALDGIGFDPAVDRLFSVGDLVDRGDESEKATEWMDKSWFQAVRGNHEQMTIDSHVLGATDLHFINGGQWFYCLQSDERGQIAAELSELPLVVEVETAAGVVGFIHADCPRRDWSDLISTLEQGGSEAEHVGAMCQWSRKRITDRDESFVQNVRAVVVGHTPLKAPVLLGNVYHIDTAGWHPSGRFTLLDLHTLEPVGH
ncbi:metallophosphoesterase [Stutzerimonas kunmingensis]|uniref:metallophosphoesterase n=1 Tax=Stutzerimonas kunmingensis TaxID=1211807 RepID=UPI0035E43E15